MKSSFFSLRGRRGNIEIWVNVSIVLSLAFVGFVVLAILLGAFKTTSLACPSSYTYNTTADNCYLNSNNSVTSALTTAGNVTNNGLTFVGNTTGQMPVAGTVLGVALLLVIIGGVGFAGYRMYNKMR